MRLTNDMRKAFADRVMRSVKMKSKWDKDKIVAEIEKRYFASFPKEVQDFSKKFPAQTGRTSLCVDWMRHRDGDISHYVRANVICGYDSSKVDVEDLKKHWEEFRNEIGDRVRMRNRILEVANAVTTTEALAAALPKLIKFIPEPEKKPTKMLPTTTNTLFNDLKKMGLEITQ